MLLDVILGDPPRFICNLLLPWRPTLTKKNTGLKRLDGWENKVFEDVILSASGNRSWRLIFATYDSLHLHSLVMTPPNGSL
jgi:hypothetical protein